VFGEAMDPELVAKLSSRLRKVEGDSAKMPKIAASSAKAPGKLDASRWSRQNSEDTCESLHECSPCGVQSRRLPQRVRVPDWVVEGHGVSTPRFVSSPGTWKGGASSSQATPEADARSQPLSPEVQLERRLQQAEKERDLAEAQVLKAQAAAEHWSSHLASEARRMRDTWAELQMNQDDTASQAKRLRNAGGIKDDAFHGNELDQLHHQIRELSIQLFELGQEKSTISVRSVALQAELERQEEDCRQLVADLEASEQLEVQLQSELLAAGTTASGGEVETPSKLSPRDKNEFEVQEVDLEFAYDWGLELSGHMSINRAMRLAQQARQRSIKMGKRKIEEDELAHFDVPIADLVDALKVLKAASEEEVPLEDLGSFDAPLADLQKVLAELVPEAPPFGDEGFEDAIASLKEVVTMMSEDSKKAEEKVAKEASHASSDEKELPPFGDEGFEDSIASLKEVVAMISNGSKIADEKVI
ncbi:unnamed protein product, partial [Durusdinium trenchii]